MHHHMKIASLKHCCGQSMDDLRSESFDLLTLLGFHNVIQVGGAHGSVSDFLVNE